MPETLSHKWFPAATNPEIPKPAAHEVAALELLVHEHMAHHHQPVLERHDRVLVPKYNKMYGSQRTEGGWRYVVDNYAFGTITTVAATLVQAKVTLALTPPNWRLEQWPGATTLFLALRSFSIAPQTATFATAGSLDWYFQDAVGGQVIPLGDSINNASLNQSLSILIPSPITDPGNAVVGNLQVTLNTGATVGVYNWQLAFSAAYLIPAMQGYEVEHIENVNSHAGNTHHASE